MSAARATKGAALLDLTVGNPTTANIYEKDTAERAADARALEAALSAPGVHRYAPDTLGDLRAREAVAAHCGCAPERVVITASTSESYAHLFALFCDAGDTALCPTPSYPLIEHLAQARGVEPVPYPLRHDDGWAVDAARFEALIDERSPRAILAVSPNNPTGSWLSADDMARFAATGLPVVVDEVFAEYPLSRPRPAFDTRPALTVRLGGLSKLAALPQVKLGWMILEGDDGLCRESIARLELGLDTFLSVSASAQADVPALLELGARRRRRVHRRVRANLAALDARTRHTPLSLLPPEAGWYAIVRLPAVLDESEYAERLLDEAVLCQPGWLYDLALPGPAIVLSLLTPRADFEEGVARLVRLVEAVCA